MSNLFKLAIEALIINSEDFFDSARDGNLSKLKVFIGMGATANESEWALMLMSRNGR